jgi:DtxR family Mn-dependent transcriptional regulator
VATVAVENYLKHVLLLSEDGGELVSMGALATALAVVPGTATTMVKAMADEGLVEHQPRQGVRLTAKGRGVALNVLRKHRLVETFLVNVLKMDWSKVHTEAEQLEHAISDEVLKGRWLAPSRLPAERREALHAAFELEKDPTEEEAVRG